MQDETGAGNQTQDLAGALSTICTEHPVAEIIAKILAGYGDNLVKYSVFDPAAGSGTLILQLSHEIGIKKCELHTQDISQEVSEQLHMNLIFHGMTEYVGNITAGNSLTELLHCDKKFDIIVCDPPFYANFSGYRDSLLSDPSSSSIFFAGIPGISERSGKGQTPIYLLFIQYILWKLSGNGRAAVIVPSAFLTRQKQIEKNIREELIENGWLKGVVSIPPNIFGNPGPSVLFIDKTQKNDDVILIDASRLRARRQWYKKQSATFTDREKDYIVQTFLEKKTIHGLSVAVGRSRIRENGYSLITEQYFAVRQRHEEMSYSEFRKKISELEGEIENCSRTGRKLESEINDILERIQHE